MDALIPMLSLGLAAYLLGSLSSAVIVCKIGGYPDPRTGGSGNPGTTNVLRMGGKLPAIITLICDALKGLLPVLVAKQLGLPATELALVMLAPVLGHLFPVFFRFKGGKGVATGLGVLVGLSPWVGLSLLAVWISVVALTRISSLGAICAAASAPLVVYWQLADVPLTAAAVVLALLLLWRHKANIARLLAGSEAKI